MRIYHDRKKINQWCTTEWHTRLQNLNNVYLCNLVQNALLFSSHVIIKY